MEKTKTVLDREPISSEYVNSRQDFEKVVSGYKALKPPVWKSAWFYGTAGLATIAIVTSVVLYNPESTQVNDGNKTKTATTIILENPKKDSPNTKKNYIAQAEPVKDEGLPVKDKPSANSEPSNPGEEMETNPADEEPEDELMNTEDSRVNSIEDEVENEVEIVPPVQNMLPHVNSVYFGEIPYFKLCDGKGLQVNDDLAIISFKVQYYVGRQSIEKSIKGNRIPSDLCEDITRNSMGNTVFFTEIRAEHRVTGRTTHLNSMHLIPVK